METLDIGEVYQVLEGHAGDVNGTAWSPTDKDTMVSCCGDKKIRVWKIGGSTSQESMNTPAHTVVAHELYINSCAYNPSGDLLVTTSSDETMKIWSTVSWTCIGTLSQHEASVRACSFSPDGNLLASASDDCTVKIWEVGALKCINTITKHAHEVTCCQFAPNGWLLATGTSSGLFLLFDAFTGNCVAKKRIGPAAHDGGVNAIAVEPIQHDTPTPMGGKEVFQFASAGNDCEVIMWKVECDVNRMVTGAIQDRLNKHAGPVYSLAYHPTRPIIATGSRDKSVILWHTVTFNIIRQLQAHSRYVTHISFSPSGSYLATASNDRTVKVWTLTTATSASTSSQEVGKETQSTSEAVDSATPSIISTMTWSVGEVCQWAESVAKQQNTPGGSVHPDDIRAANRLVKALDQVSLTSTRSGSEDYKCPITCEVMRDPVVASDGYSYERSAITGWFSKGRRTSPVTNLPLSSSLLLPNKALRVAIDKERGDSNS